MFLLEEQADKEIKVIVFRLLSEQFGVDVQHVQSIERIETITKVPRAPSFVKGVIHLRGAVIPIIDLKERLKLGEAEWTNDSRVILLSLKGCEVGIIVDSANDVIDIPASKIVPPPRMMAGVDMKYLQGIAKLADNLLILLNVEQVLDTDEIEQIFKGEGLLQ